MPWPFAFAAALLVTSCALALALIPRLDEALRRETARRVGEPANDNVRATVPRRLARLLRRTARG